MRDKTHDEQIERWVKFMKENPNKWKKIHTEFIDAQFDMHYKFVERILKTPMGKEKLIKLFSIKNIDGYDFLK